jgi:hypothetical protein
MNIGGTAPSGLHSVNRRIDLADSDPSDLTSHPAANPQIEPGATKFLFFSALRSYSGHQNPTGTLASS